MKHRGTLFRVVSIHNNLSGDRFVGAAFELPVVGKRFWFYVFPTDEDGEGLIRTTEIQEIQEINASTVEFRTSNSTYRIEYERTDK